MMHRSILFAFSVVAAGAIALAVPSPSEAYTCAFSECVARCAPVTYSIGAIPASLNELDTVSDIRDAVDAWGVPECSEANATYDGRTASGAGLDGVSVITFVESGWAYPSDVAAVSAPVRDPGGCISEADIEFNAEDFTWSNTMPTSGTTANVFAFALRGGGIFFGLGSSDDMSAVLHVSNFGALSELAADDEAGICALYPAAGCSGPGDCSAGESCVDGECTPDTTRDAGTPDAAAPDAGPADTGSADSASGVDSSTGGSDGGGCSVNTAPNIGSAWPLGFFIALAFARRRP
ncbi:MAG: hypothetical protein JRH11_01655 [Deltaproteobacteria bacterium]|nr:hypothetical protein [Deltaproteobacteria bacterium]